MATDTGGANAQLRELADLAAVVAEFVVAALAYGHSLFFGGNGGSAAAAQHLAAEYVVRFRRKRMAIPALALTTDTSVLTAGGNDFGFATVFARQVEALGREGDVFFLHSTSGGGLLRGRVERALVVPTTVNSRAQEIQLAMGHVICELVDRALADAQ